MKRVRRTTALRRGGLMVLALASFAQPNGSLAQPSPSPAVGLPSQTTCPEVFQRPEATRAANAIARQLGRQAENFDTPSAMIVVRQDMNSTLRLQLPSSEYLANQGLIASVDRATVTRCWPQLAAVLDRTSPGPGGRPGVGAGQPSASLAPDRASPTGRAESDYDRFVARQKREREAADQESEADAQRKQVRAEAERERRDEIERNRRAENAARLEAAQQRQAETRERRAAEQQAAIERDQLREQAIADQRAAADARATAAQRDYTRQREVEAEQQAAERARRAEEHRRSEEVRLQGFAEERARIAAQEEERQKAARLVAEQQQAERQKRPECREADRIAQEAGGSVQSLGGVGAIIEISTKFQAGMNVEACALTRKTFTSVERLRSATARCEPTDAIPINKLATALREIILNQGC